MLQPGYQVKLYQPNLLHQVVNLLSFLWGDNYSQNLAYFQWKYHENPVTDNPLGIVTQYKGKVVAFRGYFATKWKIQEKNHDIFVLCPGDTVVHPDHRRKKLSVIMGGRAMESVQAARNGLMHLQNQVRNIATAGRNPENMISAEHKTGFLEAVNDDLNMPRAMAAVQDLLKSSVSDDQKYTTILEFDQVLGLDLDRLDQPEDLPSEVQKLVDARLNARENKQWDASDRLRDEIQDLGYLVQDTPEGMKVIKK